MNILFITPRLSETGGIERYTYEVTRRLAQKHTITILCHECDTVPGNVTVIRKQIPKIIPVWLRTLLFAILCIGWSKELRRCYAIDLVISNGSASLKSDIVVAHSVHKASIIETNKLYVREKGNRVRIRNILRYITPGNVIINFIERKVYRRCFCIAVSEGVRRELQELYQTFDDRIAVIANGVDIDQFKPNVEKRKEIRQRFDILDRDTILLFVGHQFARKGLGFIIDALAQLPHTIKLFVIGGDDASMYKIQAQKLACEDRIYFFGKQKDELSAFYTASDLFVFPTSYEAFSLATLEAASSGLPILATKVNGTEELIEPRINGDFIDRNGNSIAQTIKDILGTGVLTEFKENARKTAEYYSWDRVVERVEEVCNNFLR